MSDKNLQVGRRGFVRGVVAGVAVAATAQAVTTAGSATAEGTPGVPEAGSDLVTGGGPGREPVASAGAASPEVLALFGDLTPGTRVGDCTIAAVKDVHLGAIPVLLTTPSGQTVQVDVMRQSSDEAPLAQTGSLSLFLANRGDGAKPTDETAGLGAMALAEALRQRESAGARAPALLTFAERRASHPLGVYAVI